MSGIPSAIAAAAPCSVELPAGTGKTELVAELAATIAADGGRSLILTHTHAGVDAMRRRLRRHQVPVKATTVTTIDAWSFNLARRMPLIGQAVIPDPPDWTAKTAYCAAATRVIGSRHIRRVLQLSYDFGIVDEYQDCSLDQHHIVDALTAAVPVVVFGDRLQGLYDFDRQDPSVRWLRDVQPIFPDHPVPVQAWRWHDTAPDLGAWLLSIRDPLLAGQAIDLASSPATWRGLPSAPGDRLQVTDQTLRSRTSGTVVGIGHFRADIVAVARRLRGGYQVMEPLHGKVAEAYCALVDRGPGPELAAGTAQLVKDCLANVADTLTKVRIDRLAVGAAPRVRDAQTAATIAPFVTLLTSAKPTEILDAFDAARALPGSTLHCAELWHEVRSALELAGREATAATVSNTLARNRARAAQNGRRGYPATMSTPLLIKGLEYDHAIVINADGYTAPELYVALTRGRQSVTVLSRTSSATPISRHR